MGKTQSKQSEPESKSVIKKQTDELKIGVFGGCGVGKSSFINAFRGINEDDVDAAMTGVLETTTEPTCYTHPGNPYIKLIDTPGYETPLIPNLEIFCHRVDLESCDMFLILISTRFTYFDLHLFRKIKALDKPLLLIRTKIDIDIQHERRKRRLNKDDVLSRIREYILSIMKQFEIGENNLFLISNCDPYKWDFPRLFDAIFKMLPAYQKEALSPLSFKRSCQEKTAWSTEENLHDEGRNGKEKGDSSSEEFLKNKLKAWKGLKIRYGITGDSGAGKSAFINAIRGLHDDDYENGAAHVDVTEATMEPTEYKHPLYPTISFVDLPGIGTPKFHNFEKYCKDMRLKDYDKFLIFTATRFTVNDLNLAKKVKSLGKPFFLIRTKIDNDCFSESRKESFNEEEMLKNIRKSYCEKTKDLMVTENKIFLISNYDKEKWDFTRLVTAISEETQS
ncbi:interferon-inducible GTPase 5-like [Dendronephthya gigantea]|uniref:interferon-inducible GTPase 5-like n=1 Tax=Dendronephthya gigantea TaxID=151771 RepID=UPI00106AEA7B|nr:interferon-inducible GTPase 5-like [Dendronephthya gigantea]XP_028404281.1 interferon-inducible GTPase 5-like [Dendronephthya gigantea]